MTATPNQVGDTFTMSAVVCRGCGSFVYIYFTALEDHLKACDALTAANAVRDKRLASTNEPV